jgi:hypothetical protein
MQNAHQTQFLMFSKRCHKEEMTSKYGTHIHIELAMKKAADSSQNPQIRVEINPVAPMCTEVPDYEVWLDHDVIGGEIYERSDNSS